MTLSCQSAGTSPAIGEPAYRKIAPTWPPRHCPECERSLAPSVETQIWAYLHIVIPSEARDLHGRPDHQWSALVLNRCPSGKPPSVSFETSRAILALPIWLIDRLRVDDRPRHACAPVVRVDIIDMHDQAGVGNISVQRGVEVMLRRHAV